MNNLWKKNLSTITVCMSNNVNVCILSIVTYSASINACDVAGPKLIFLKTFVSSNKGNRLPIRGNCLKMCGVSNHNLADIDFASKIEFMHKSYFFDISSFARFKMYSIRPKFTLNTNNIV